MKALTVKNPWAGTILLLGKDVENRTRKTNYRGRVLIHSSRMQDMGAYHGTFGKMFSNPDFRDKLCFGCIIGSVELFDCIPNAESKWAEPGLWHWRVRDPIVFEDPIAVKGNLGIWEYNGKLPDEMKKSE